MPLTLDSTLSGESSESYISIATADSYHQKRSGYSAWAALDNDDKVRALIGATDLLERLAYHGEKAVSTQALKFPRIYRNVSDGSSIPRMIQHAMAELALWVATNTTSTSQASRAARRAAGVTSFKLGELSETYGEAGVAAVSGTGGTMSELPAPVQRLISDWVQTGFASDSGRRHWGIGNYDRNGLWWPSELMP